MHIHQGHWDDVPPETQTFLASRFPFPLNLAPQAVADSLLSAEGALAEMNKAGVEQGVLYAVYAPQTVGIASNELVGEQMAFDPARLYGFGSLRVDHWNTDEEQELRGLEDAIVTYGMIGVKLAHAHMQFRLDDPRYYSIYELAGQLGTPVYLHTGTSPFPGTRQEPPYTDPAYLEEAIGSYPDTIFILGHLGYDFINK
ncbi:MAG: amidohydrolase family protein, partial [Myxococcota bacterium]